MSTSYAYNFQNFNTGDLILAAYRRLGIKNAEVTGEDILNARIELNLIFSHWVNKHLNLFTLEQDLLELIPGQTTYLLPPATVKILNGAMITLDRQLSGIASASEGNADNAFDGNLTTSCVQTQPNGWIQYTYSIPQAIQYVGIVTPIKLYLSLDVQYSITAPPNEEWQTILTIPPQDFYGLQSKWFILPYQQTATAWRIVETGGSVLDIAELYFDVPGQSFQLMTASPRETIFAYPPQSPNYPENVSGSFTYWVNRTRDATVSLYGLPGEDYTHFIFWRTRQLQDIDLMTGTQEMSQRFFQAAVYDLANVLALQKNIQVKDVLEGASTQTYTQAASADKDYPKSNINTYQLGRS